MTSPVLFWSKLNSDGHQRTSISNNDDLISGRINRKFRFWWPYLSKGLTHDTSKDSYIAAAVECVLSVIPYDKGVILDGCAIQRIGALRYSRRCCLPLSPSHITSSLPQVPCPARDRFQLPLALIEWKRLSCRKNRVKKVVEYWSLWQYCGERILIPPSRWCQIFTYSYLNHIP